MHPSAQLLGAGQYDSAVLPLPQEVSVRGTDGDRQRKERQDGREEVRKDMDKSFKKGFKTENCVK